MKIPIKVIALSLSLMLLSLLAFTGFAHAQSFRSGRSISVGGNETINSLLMVGGDNINIAGTVNGDVYCGGQNITISGTVNGDVICGGQNVNISGKIQGNVRLAGQDVNVTGTVSGSATVFSQLFSLGKDAAIRRDLFIAGQSATIDGAIGRDVVAEANNFTVNGTIGRDVKGDIETLTVGSGGTIRGSVNYSSPNDPTIESGGKIVGTVQRHPAKVQNNAGNIFAAVALFSLYMLIAVLILGLILVLLMPGVFEDAAVTTVAKPGITILIGAAAALLVPILVFLLLITVVGIPLAILVILIWLVIMFLFTPFVAYLLGRLILRNTKMPVVAMLLGIVLLAILYLIPILDIFVGLAAYLLGVGMIIMQLRRLYDRPRMERLGRTSSSTSKVSVDHTE